MDAKFRIVGEHGHERIFLSEEHAQSFLKNLITSERRDVRMNDFQVLYPGSRGGGHPNPEDAKNVRVSIHESKTGTAMNIILGEILVREKRWLKGDRIVVALSQSDPHVMQLQRAAANSIDGFTLSGDEKKKKTLRIKYRKPMVRVDTLTTCELVSKDGDAIVFRIPKQ